MLKSFRSLVNCSNISKMVNIAASIYQKFEIH